MAVKTRNSVKRSAISRQRSAKNGYIGRHKVEDWVHAKFRDAAKELATLDGDDLKRGFSQAVDEISDWSGIAKKEVTHYLHMAMTEVIGKRRRGRNGTQKSAVRNQKSAKRNPWFNVEIITPDHTIREQLMSGTRAEVRKRVREEYGERAQILGFSKVANSKTVNSRKRKYELYRVYGHLTGDPSAKRIIEIGALSPSEAVNRANAIDGKNILYKTAKSLKIKPNPEIDFDGETFNRDKLDQLSATFQGEISGDEVQVDASEMVPNRTARLGALKQIKIVDESGEPYDIQFKNGAWLTADARKNLFCVGRGARINGIKLPKKGELSILGNVTQIDYQTAKRHIENGKETYYYHETGEVDSQRPVLLVDHHGYPHIYSGNYDIGIHGIEN